MAAPTATELREKQCRPCEGRVAPIEKQEAAVRLKALPGWRLSDDGKRIHREWTVKDFMAGMEFFEHIARVAQQEDHHPDLHLENYRDVRVELSTHAIKGLSENDLILAAKIDALPVKEKAK